jgi:hypothetical protein
VSEPLNDVRVTNSIERDGFVLKVLNQRQLKIRIGSPLQSCVQRLDDDGAAGIGLIVGKENLGIAPATEAALNQVAIIDYAVFQSKLGHVSLSTIED